MQIQYTTIKKKAKILFVSGKANSRQNFFENRAGGEPYSFRQKSFWTGTEKSQTKAPNALGGHCGRQRKNRRKRKLFENCTHLQPRSNLFPKKLWFLVCACLPDLWRASAPACGWFQKPKNFPTSFKKNGRAGFWKKERKILRILNFAGKRRRKQRDIVGRCSWLPPLSTMPDYLFYTIFKFYGFASIQPQALGPLAEQEGVAPPHSPWHFHVDS